jgi:lipoyl-dependent peroxiredoxin
MKIQRKASAVWTGGLRDGRGAISTGSGAIKDQVYGFSSRFEGQPGTNPEELLGAAHAGCFTMAVSAALGEAGVTAEHLETNAAVTLARDGGGFSIPAVALRLEARIPGIDEAKFQEIAAKAKTNCPLSKVLRAEITLEAKLV